MPELPDVEIYKQYFDLKALKHKIKGIEVRVAGFIEKGSRDISELKNASFVSTSRYGKYLFARSNHNLYLAMHFGMTGFLYDSAGENPYDAHSRFLLHFDNGHFLAFVDYRLLGRVSLIDSVENYIHQRRLGPDALDIPYEKFQSLFKGSGSVKSLFLDQHKLAGVGNIYADEILFHAKIHPQSKVSSLHDREIKDLYKKMDYILKHAISAHADAEKMPSSWLLPKRKIKTGCPRCKEPIQKATIAGRPTYFCPHCQQMS